ncbi:hypothetical protein ACVH9Z_14690, partial [Rhodococcus opacus]
AATCALIAVTREPTKAKAAARPGARGFPPAAPPGSGGPSGGRGRPARGGPGPAAPEVMI